MKKIITLSIVALALASCEKKGNNVKYEVTCAECSLTYSNSSDNTEQGSTTNGWEYGFDAEPGHFLYISAQNKRSSGTVTVKILVNGKVKEESSSSGAYVIATASMSMP